MTLPRSPLSWEDLTGRRVGVYGLGVEGHASLAALRARGIEPAAVVDDRPGAGAGGVLATGDGGLAALAGCEVVIKSPGISRYGETVRSLADAGVAVVGGTGMWFAGADRSRVLLVTGTKGKSTTTAIAGHLLRGLGFRVMVGGNLGYPPYDPAVGANFDYWVVEVSSYQATDLAVSPPVTVVTSLNPDHLPWHAGDVETYYRDKLSATSQPGAAVTVANGDSPLLRSHAALLGPRVVWVGLGETGREGGLPGDPASGASDWTEGLNLIGAHNRRNALIARQALIEMHVPGADDDAVITAAAQGFSGLPSRLQVVGSRGGVTFVDDGLSTNVLPVLAAVDAFAGRRVALLVGGHSRGIDYAPLGVGLRRRELPLLMVTMPTNGADIRRQVETAGPGPQVTLADAVDLDHAVAIAAEWADPDGVVLLSPAAPSFDRYRDYRDRGEAFVRAIVAVGALPS